MTSFEVQRSGEAGYTGARRRRSRRLLPPAACHRLLVRLCLLVPSPQPSALKLYNHPAAAAELLEQHPDTRRFLAALEALQAPAAAASAADETPDWRAARGLFAAGSGAPPIYVARAPGRLDVMGGIADYSGSLVLQARLGVSEPPQLGGVGSVLTSVLRTGRMGRRVALTPTCTRNAARAAAAGGGVSRGSAAAAAAGGRRRRAAAARRVAQPAARVAGARL